MGDGEATHPLIVLMVCTGNIGRSPMMERLMRQELAVRNAGSRITVASAGTWGQAGQPMELGAKLALRERGVDADAFEATPLSESTIVSSDLILVATRDHRSEVVAMVPSAVRRTFTLHEFARIVATAPAIDEVGDVREAVAWAARMRGSVSRPATDSDDDLPDPLGAPDDVYRERAAAIAVSVERIVPYLLGETSAG